MPLGPVRLRSRRIAVPRGHEGFQRISGTSQRKDLLMFMSVHRLVTMKDIGGLPEREPKVGPVERDIHETGHRTAEPLLRGQSLWIELNPGKGDARLHPSLY